MLTVSYVIGTHNEDPNYIKSLLDQLLKYIDPQDEIVVVDDFSSNQDTLRMLSLYEDRVNIHQHKLNGDFATHKNYMNSLAKGDYIFNIDADENVNEFLLKALKEILLSNPTAEVYYLPRINIVPDITETDMKNYKWSFYPGTNYINLPDLQGRIYKNNKVIKWEGKVHEQLSGFVKHSVFPFLNEEGEVDASYCLLHVKNIERQRQQNSFYEQL